MDENMTRSGEVGLAPKPQRLSLPLDRAELAQLRVGDACLLTGPMFTLRDAGHIRLLAELDAQRDAAAGGKDATGAAGVADAAAAPSATVVPSAPSAPATADRERLPYGLDGQAIFYAGPTPAAAGRPFGAIGPTTASRMDFAAPRLYDAGIAATIGKGTRNAAVHEACMRNKAVYFVTVGGAAAYLAKCVESSETLAYDDLGTEALRRVDVVDFPVFVGIDTVGNDIYDRGNAPSSSETEMRRGDWLFAMSAVQAEYGQACRI